MLIRGREPVRTIERFMIRIAAALALMALLPASALAQAAAPTPPPARTAALGAIDVVKALSEKERAALQSDLAWTGHYNGALSGEVGERTIAAIKAFQRDQGGKQTGVLNPQEREALAAAAKRLQQNVGWTLVTDPATGTRLGLPLKRTPRKIADGGLTTWNSPQDTIQIQFSHRREPGVTTTALAERARKEPAGRKVTYATVKPDFFVLSGLQGLKKFYQRGHVKGDQVRILTILYDQATEGTMEPVVIAMSSAFNPFPAGAPVTKPVEYATGLVVSTDGAILTTAEAVAGCASIVAPQLGGNAEKVAEEKSANLALLRLYGARNLTPLALGGGEARAGALDVVGIADPQLQNGGATITRVSTRASSSGNELALTPPPTAGFAGAPALSGHAFAGLASGGALIRAETVRAFLTAQGVTAANGTADPREAVTRIICVRK